MAPITDSDIVWYSELDIVAKTGLPGPLVADLLPRLPTPPGGYSNRAQVYDPDSIQRALLVIQMLRVGIRLRFIHMVMAHPMTAEQITDGIAEWTALPDYRQPDPPPATPRLSRHQLVAILAASNRAPWVWGRVAGDALDIATARRPAAIGALAGVTAIDIGTAVALERQNRAPRRTFDYSDRSGFPRPAAEMRGSAAKKERAGGPLPVETARI